MAKVLDITNQELRKMNEKEKGNYLSKLIYNPRIDPNTQREKLLELGKIYEELGNLVMAGYCLENARFYDEASKLYAKAACSRISKGRISNKGLSEIEQLAEVSFTHPNKIDKKELGYIKKFFELNCNVDEKIPILYKKAKIIYKTKSRAERKDRITKNKEKEIKVKWQKEKQKKTRKAMR